MVIHQPLQPVGGTAVIACNVRFLCRQLGGVKFQHALIGSARHDPIHLLGVVGLPVGVSPEALPNEGRERLCGFLAIGDVLPSHFGNIEPDLDLLIHLRRKKTPGPLLTNEPDQIGSRHDDDRVVFFAAHAAPHALLNRPNGPH